VKSFFSEWGSIAAVPHNMEILRMLQNNVTLKVVHFGTLKCKTRFSAND